MHDTIVIGDDANSDSDDEDAQSFQSAIAIDSASETEPEQIASDESSRSSGRRVAFAFGTARKPPNERRLEEERLTQSASARPVTRSATNSTKSKYNKRDTIFVYEKPGTSKSSLPVARRCFDATPLSVSSFHHLLR